MPTLTLSAKDPASLAADALVVGLTSSASGLRLATGTELSAAVKTRLSAAAEAAGASAQLEATQRIPPVPGMAARSVLLVGMGDSTQARDAEAVRRAAGAAANSLAGLNRAVFALPAGDGASIGAVCEGALLGAYAYNRYRTQAGAKPALAAITVTAAQAVIGGARGITRRARLLAGAVHGTRDLINAAPADLYPATFAAQAQQVVAGLPIKFSVLDERRLARGGYGGLIAVGQGSSRPPRLVRLDYHPASADRHIALVGKGITFDSGGLSIKTAKGMEEMKSDMSGAAAVLHTVAAAAQLELPVRITGWLALAENMPSGTAQRPSDVITIRGGRTVEVLNTDAEGRLVLADAIVAAGELRPDFIIDIATLTGAQMIALGNRVSAVMANDDELRGLVTSAAAESGEQFWPMPLPAELRASMDSRVADIANIGERFGGMLVAGLFLKEFVPVRDGVAVPWAHLDIAGPSFNGGRAHGYTPEGGTGVGVRTLLTLSEGLSRSPK